MEKITLNISSLNKNNKSKFIYNLPSLYNNIKYIKIKSIEIPNIFMSITSNRGNNNFKLLYNSNEYNIILEDGNYTSSTIALEIQKKLDIINILTGQSFIITINPINNYTTIINNNNNSFNLNFTKINNNNNLTLGNHLGFQNNEYDNILSITSENKINLSYDNFFFIKINDFENIRDNIVKYAFSKIILNDNDLCNTYNYHINENNIINNTYYFRNLNNIKQLHIELVDNNDEYLNINPFNWNFTLEIGFIYDISKIDKLYSDTYIHIYP